jgi:hypothetical protein
MKELRHFFGLPVVLFFPCFRYFYLSQDKVSWTIPMRQVFASLPQRDAIGHRRFTHLGRQPLFSPPACPQWARRFFFSFTAKQWDQ